MSNQNANSQDGSLETMAQRLGYAINTYGQTAIAKEIGISPTQAYRIANGKSKTTLETAMAICVLTDFNIDWVCFGRGPMMSNQELWEHTSGFTLIESLDQIQKSNLSFEPSFLNDTLKVTPAQIRVWQIDYKVALKTLERGFSLLVNIEDKKGGGLFVINVNGIKTVADIHQNIDGSATIKTNSDNPETDQLLTASQLENLNILGRVIWHGGQS